jgi:arylsulfatase A-like enzyme
MLSKYKDRMEIFPNFYSDFAGSINARFATFTGVYPVRDFNAFTVRHVPAKSIFETLNDNGYACSLFYSSYFDYTGFRDFLRGRGIAEMYDADTMPGERKAAPVSWGLQETDTLSAMRSRIKKYADDKQKFFLTYVPAAPHNPFDGTPKEFRKHEIEKIGDFTPLYLNELTYMDWVIASLVDELKTDGLLDKTIVVITGDHGEMVGEDGGPVGHGWAINPELQNVPLIIMDPERPNFRVNKTLGSQVDLMPTLLDLLGIPVPEGQLYQGGSLYSPGLPADRKIYINSYRDYGIIHNGQFTCGSRESGTGSDKPQKTYTFANENTHTTFSLEDAESSRLTITDFDRFQENLLYNYTDYCRMFGNKTDGRTGK